MVEVIYNFYKQIFDINTHGIIFDLSNYFLSFLDICASGIYNRLNT